MGQDLVLRTHRVTYVHCRSSVIDTIRDACESDDNAALCYHYCRFSDASTISPERLLGAIICQVLKSTETEIPASLTKLFRRYRARSSPPCIRDLHPVLEDLLQAIPISFIIIDGLDEVQDRSELVLIMANLSSRLRGCTCKVFLSSRPEADLFKAFGSWEHTVTIRTADIAADMEKYVTRGIGRLRLDQEAADVLAHELVKRADGV